MMLAFFLLLPSLALAMNLRVNAPHLFLDLDGLAMTTNLSIVPGLITKDYERPVVAGEEQWDAFMAGYSSLLLTTSVAGVPTYYLYYSCAAIPPTNQSGNYVCLTTTVDGRSWVKPALPAFPWTDGRLTNRVFSTKDGFMGNVFIDDGVGVPEDKRFKLSYSATDPSGNYGGVYLAASADGFYFQAGTNSSVQLPAHYGDTQPAILWDAARMRYAIFGRGNNETNWNSTHGCAGGNPVRRRVLGAFSASGAGEGFGNASIILNYGPPDQLDCLDVYNSSPLLIDDDSGSNGAILFFPSSYHHFAQIESWKNGSNDGVLDVRVAVSRDGGATAAFVSREAFIPRGMGALAAPGTFTAIGSDPDAGCVFATAGGLLDPDKLAPLPYTTTPSPRVWFLFYGTQRTHWPIWTPTAPVDAGFNGILRGSLRREGFAGLRTPFGDPTGAGSFTTVPLLVPQPTAVCGGNASAQLWLLLNVQTSAAGGVSVALLSPGNLEPLPGRGPADALPFVGDVVRSPVAWAPSAEGGEPVRNLAPFAGTQVVISVSLVHAQLFAWELQCV